MKSPFFSGVLSDHSCEPPAVLSNTNECCVTVENAAMLTLRGLLDGVLFDFFYLASNL